MNRRRLEQAFPGLHVLGSCLVRSFLLIDQGEATLIDSGLLWEPRTVRSRLQSAGLGLEHLTTILLTHGHLDHTANLAWYRKHTHVRIRAHPQEQVHIDGAYPYPKANRLCHLLEATGRRLLAYEPVTIDAPLTDSDKLPNWGGLQVVSLPGHTSGHCGFYSPRHDLLFTGDLFACYPIHAALPPAGLNSCPERSLKAYLEFVKSALHGSCQITRGTLIHRAFAPNLRSSANSYKCSVLLALDLPACDCYGSI